MVVLSFPCSFTFSLGSRGFGCSSVGYAPLISRINRIRAVVQGNRLVHRRWNGKGSEVRKRDGASVFSERFSSEIGLYKVIYVFFTRTGGYFK